MGSPATPPPWMTELLARKHKWVRNMWSVDSDAEVSDSMTPNRNSAVDPTPVPKMAAVVLEQMNKNRRTTTSTSAEKPNAIRDDQVYMDDVGSKVKCNLRNGEEESILEYGPGIVRKLRTRYQSLALRQYNSRPNLRRSASLENVLDGVDGGVTSPTPDEVPYNKAGDKGTAAFSQASVSSSTTVPHAETLQKSKPSMGGVRGRSQLSERNKDRMRRARSVDALHRTKNEEEILEKFKAVVLPREEIVIIEVSKPRTNLGGLTSNATPYYLPSSEDKSYPTQLLINAPAPDVTLTAESPAESRGVRSFASPEHELPPHDIVRETARIFEKNQDNLAMTKKVGQALRMSKSNLTTASPVQSPTSSSPSPRVRVPETSNKSPSPMFNSATSHVNHGVKQVGVIRPTLNHQPTPVSPGELEKEKLNKLRENGRAVPLSPTYKALTQQKPPLSPKPLYTSSPKPSVLNLNGRLVKSPSLDSPTGISPINETVKPTVIVRKVDNASPLSSRIASFDSPSPPLKAPSISIIGKKFSTSLESFDNSSDTSVKKVTNGISNDNANVPRKVVTSATAEAPSKKPSPIVNGVSNSVDNYKVFTKKHEEHKPVPSPAASKSVFSDKSVPTKKSDELEKASQLRIHQKQKSNQGNNTCMVFNFTSRPSVPDYIEDDGLHRRGMTLSGAVNDESVDDFVDTHPPLDAKNIKFEGANVIINGKSSIQKKPKSTKLNISINEQLTTTYEYPSESSMLAEGSNDMEKATLGHKSPNVISNGGSGLGNYTPKLSNDYQLGTYVDANPASKKAESKEESSNELIEDYLKPDSETTTWSNEITADILF